MANESHKKHFILVHGGGHGAWCWYKLAALLERAGHRATAVDMAGCGIHPNQVDEVQSFREYVQPLMEVMAMLPSDEKVVLVGHSFGGLSMSLAMEAFPDKISVAVFAAAFMPSPNLAPSEAYFENLLRAITPDFLLDSTCVFGRGPENHPTTISLGVEFLTANMYQNSPPEDLKLASMLCRPAKMFLEDLDDKSMLTMEKFGSVSRVYIVSKQDKAIDEGVQRWMVDKASGCDVMVIEGSDHMVMFSKPQELFDCLLKVAENHV